MARRHAGERGFTMIEIVVVVALIGILAAVALPSYFGTSRRAKAESEVMPMFQDLRTRMDQYIQENGIYPASLGESTTCPAAPSSTKQNIYSCGNWPSFQALKVKLSGENQVYCAYTWVTGLASTGPVGARATSFGFTVPAMNWYYLLAHCDMDGSATVDGWYFTSSVDPTIKKQNSGR